MDESTPSDYCREIEAYLCRKNDGHLIRVTGPSFDLVVGWAERGVPLKVAFAGIDRYFERYYRSGPRRRPVKIDFCDADVLDVFDEWRRATGVITESSVISHQSSVISHQSAVGSHQSSVESHPSSVESHRSSVAKRQSLPAHLERVILRLTSARTRGALGEEFDGLIDRVASELDVARGAAHGLRGTARQQLIGRLAILDQELLQRARAGLDEQTRAALAREAENELAPFRTAMSPEVFGRAREAAIDHLVRQRFGLPTVSHSEA
jgi:hypothetical protein